MNSNSIFTRFALISTLALGLTCTGCASSASSSSRAVDPADPPAAALKTTASTQTTAVPRVQDCGVVAISSPPKYVCSGKVYTATQLAKVRNDQAKKYQSGQ